MVDNLRMAAAIVTKAVAKGYVNVKGNRLFVIQGFQAGLNIFIRESVMKLHGRRIAGVSWNGTTIFLNQLYCLFGYHS